MGVVLADVVDHDQAERPRTCREGREDALDIFETHDEAGGARVVEDAGEVVRRHRRLERHRCGAGVEARHFRHDIVGAGEAEQADEIPGADLRLVVPRPDRRQCGYLREELAITDRVVARKMSYGSAAARPILNDLVRALTQRWPVGVGLAGIGEDIDRPQIRGVVGFGHFWLRCRAACFRIGFYEVGCACHRAFHEGVVVLWLICHVMIVP